MANKSRRYGSKFKISVTRYNSVGNTYVNLGVGFSGANATLSVPVFAASPTLYSFVANVNLGGEEHRVVTNNPLSGQNGLPTHPPTGVNFTHASWSRVPHQVYWLMRKGGSVYDGAVITPESGSGFYPAQASLTGTIPNQLYLSWWHVIEVKNNSLLPVTVYHRDFNYHTMSPSTHTHSVVMSSWSSTVIPAGGSENISGFEPLDIKFDTNSNIQGYLGYTAQQGNKVLVVE